MRPARIRDIKMEILYKIKSILFNTRDEWAVIEAENAPHTSVFFKYLLILALIPTLGFFIGEYLQNRSMYNGYIEESIRQRYGINLSMEQRMQVSIDFAQREEEYKREYFKKHPFNNTKWSIIFAVSLFGIIVGGAYTSAALIKACSKQFGSEIDFNRAFALVAYSFTPLCIAGVLYAFKSFSSFVPFIGLYGLYLLYLGVDTQLKPAADKKTKCFVVSMIAMVGVWLGFAKVVVPEIQTKVMTKEYISFSNRDNAGNAIYIDAITTKSIEKSMKTELENHQY